MNTALRTDPANSRSSRATIRASMTQWRSGRASAIAAAILVVIGCLRILSTYWVFSATIDEPDHIASGMEWLSRGQYNYEPKHPPLERVAGALPLWIEGIRTIGIPDVFAEGAALLASRGQIQHELALARAGVLVFFVLTCSVVFLWARSLFGPWIAVVCLFEFTMIPMVLGHSALVTTDSAAMATLPLALFTFLRWVEKPSIMRLTAAGCCVGLAILAKLSAIPFLGACAGAWVVLNWIASRRFRLPVRLNFKTLAIFFLAFFLTIWAAYRFQCEPLTAAKTVRAYRSRLAPDSLLHRMELKLIEIPIPAGNLVRGLGDLAIHEQAETLQYFEGQVSADGWKLFFPVGLAVKTPLPFLFLSLAAVILALLRFLPRRNLAIVFPGAFAMAILLICVPSRINLGIRHILPMYPLLAIASGLAIQAAWNSARSRVLARISVAVALLWLGAESAVAHPDYMAYFNELTGGRPEKTLVESDLDWGQDYLRLKKTMDSLAIHRVQLSYDSKVDPAAYGVSYTRLEPCVPVAGWVAVSLHHLVFEPAAYAWLAPYSWRLVGKSIRLYYVPDPPPTPAPCPDRDDAMVMLKLK